MQAPTSIGHYKPVASSPILVLERDLQAESMATDGNSKLIGQRSHVAGKSGGKFGKDGSTKEVVRSSCVRLGTVAIRWRCFHLAAATMMKLNCSS